MHSYQQIYASFLFSQTLISIPAKTAIYIAPATASIVKQHNQRSKLLLETGSSPGCQEISSRLSNLEHGVFVAKRYSVRTKLR